MIELLRDHSERLAPREHVGKRVVFTSPCDGWTGAARGTVKDVDGDNWIMEFTATRTLVVHKSNLEVA